jgi:RHS repeat-associated protein
MHQCGAAHGFAFTGREWDTEIGLAYYRARYYDPKSGRFLSEDPIGFSGGFNFYEYVGGDPVNRRDPFGLKPGDKYRNKNKAAKEAMKEIYRPTSTRDQNGQYAERCGNICRKDDGYTYDGPNTGRPGGTSCDPEPRCPDGSRPAADYHSHPPGGDEGPSPDDKNYSTLPPPLGNRRVMYVISPTGNMYKWNPFRMKEEFLGCLVPK